MSATQALKHPYFKELREQDRQAQEGSLGPGISTGGAQSPS